MAHLNWIRALLLDESVKCLQFRSLSGSEACLKSLLGHVRLSAELALCAIPYSGLGVKLCI